MIPFAAISEDMQSDMEGINSIMLSEQVVTAAKSGNSTLGAASPQKKEISAQRATTSDSAKLLQDVPGVSLYGAGGVSSLPVIHGLADDRLRIQVDGMDLMSACPNHMNSALSYIDPTNVASATVYAGITPVSVGGDSIGGTIQVKSTAPEFAGEEEKYFTQGKVGSFFRSNNSAYGGNLSATLANEFLNFTYNVSSAQAGNYFAAQAFKNVGPGTSGSRWLAGNEVGSSEFKSINQDIGVALRHGAHLVQLNVGLQNVSFEGFPNQRMDMTGNQGSQLNLRYNGVYEWGDFEARFFDQITTHKMNMGPDRFTYGTLGMPMETEARTTGVMAQGNIFLANQDILRTGGEYQNYTLYDWWPAAGGTMGPNAFWNVDYGKRDRLDFFAEWEANWGAEWVSLIGLRSDIVSMNAAPVQGYDNGLPMWGDDAATFNASSRARTDVNWDMAALARYEPDEARIFDAGYARKSRSPNLYQRYPWSTNAMADLMNNFVGDGNGYIGNINVQPEVAHTLSASGDWHDADKEQWGIKTTAYYTYVEDYIDARRCDFGQCGSALNQTTATGFVHLQYVNHTARLYGLDLSGNVQMRTQNFGHFSVSGLLNYVRGENLSTGDNLYNIMPLNAKLVLAQRVSTWTSTAELQVVDAKNTISSVRNEIRTESYRLLNLRGSYEWKQGRFDIGVENVFNRFYAMPLGGAYVGQGNSMSTNTIAWGVQVPGMGRSLNAALNLHF